MKFEKDKQYAVFHRIDGVYYDGNLRIEKDTPTIVDGDTAKRLSKVTVTYTSFAPDGSAVADPRPRFDIKETKDGIPVSEDEDEDEKPEGAGNKEPEAPAAPVRTRTAPAPTE